MKPQAVIFDADGTLCDVRPIRHYVQGRNRDFTRFHTASAFCAPNPQVVMLVHEVVAAGMVPIEVTARTADFRWITEGWNAKYGVPIEHVFMRPVGDIRPDVEVKRDILAVIRQHFDVVAAVDDNPQVVALWEQEGIKTVIVPGFDGEVPMDVEIEVARLSYA